MTVLPKTSLRDDPVPTVQGVQCTFGDGRNSSNCDFDKVGGDSYTFVLACGDPEYVEFNITHDKVGKDTSWWMGLKNSMECRTDSGIHKLYVSGAIYRGKYPPKYWWLALGKVDVEGQEPTEWSPFYQQEFGEGRNGANIDFLAWRGKTNAFKILIGMGDPHGITFNVSHDKVGSDTRWYTGISDGYVVPTVANPVHSPGHSIYVSGAKYNPSNDPSIVYNPGAFWVFAQNRAEKNEKRALTVANAEDTAQKLSPWVQADKNASYFMGKIGTYIGASQLAIDENVYKPNPVGGAPGVYTYELKTNLGAALPYFAGEAPLPKLEDNQRFQVVMNESIRGGEPEAIANNSMEVYCTLLEVPNDPAHVDIVYRYFWPYQGETFLSVGGHAPHSAHSSDWESITVRVPKDDCLNPVSCSTSRHGSMHALSPAKLISKFDLQKRHADAGNPALDFGCFYASQNTHAIYDYSGETYTDSVHATLDYHRAGSHTLCGGSVKLLHSTVKGFEEIGSENAALYTLASWGHDWGLHVPGGPSSYSGDPKTTAPWKTANSSRDWDKTD